MNRETYNQKIATKPNQKKEDLLCMLDSCDSCINFRIRNKMPLPELKKNVWQTYHRYIDPSIKPAGYKRKQLFTPNLNINK